MTTYTESRTSAATSAAEQEKSRALWILGRRRRFLVPGAYQWRTLALLGGLTVLLSAAGAYFFATDSWRIDVYGVGQPVIVLVFMVLEAVALWRLLALVTGQLGGGDGASQVDASVRLHLERPRRLAVWALGLLLIVVPIGSLYGPLLARYADRLAPLR